MAAATGILRKRSKGTRAQRTNPRTLASSSFDESEARQLVRTLGVARAKALIDEVEANALREPVPTSPPSSLSTPPTPSLCPWCEKELVPHPKAIVWDQATVKFTLGRNDIILSAKLRTPQTGTIVFPDFRYVSVLLLLAQKRIADRARRRHESEEGWMACDDVEQRLGMSRHYLNVCIHRLRRWLESQGAVLTKDVVERRLATTQLRIAATTLEINRVRKQASKQQR